ncbi:MAG: exo-alpha-sialidase [Phycisphaerae bacterium]|nr:exo-alpha-sialidase [Gemmatimonadaceae bacterium]
MLRNTSETAGAMHGRARTRLFASICSPRSIAPGRSRISALGIALGALSAACADKVEQAPSGTLQAPMVTAFANPAGDASSSPGWSVTPSGRIYLSWQERLPDSTLLLKYAYRNDGDTTWSTVRTVKTGTNMIMSATDVPGVHEQRNGSLIAIWRGSHGEGGYDVVMARSTDSGTTWSAPKSPHGDVTPTEHGFVSWLDLGDSASMVWLDGRLNADKDTAKHVTQLALASLTSQGDSKLELMIEPKICDCCHTASALVPGGVAVVYRDRDAGEIRDISVLRLAADGWRQPVRVHNDNWHINGCPVNGPSISARDSEVAVAWFTAAGDTARVRMAFSSDTATTFAAPVEINEGFPDGKVGVVLTQRSRAIVSWIERKDSMAFLRVRAVNRDGTKSPATDVANLGQGKRAGGAPKLIQNGNLVLLAWTDAATGRVNTATIDIP